MLQRNASRAHIAHAAMISLHALCCGLPALAMMLAVTGATSGLALLSDSFADFHALLHQHEVWILGLSAALVTVGAAFEIAARRPGASHPHKGVPWLFVLSLACFCFNVAIIALHRA